jgi:Asp-tRNA(Asn)/Glu-tRNA(Gln) amidotransferase A subunit family amidase
MPEAAERARGVISIVRDAIASRQVSAEEVVRVALDRIGKLNPDLNAVVTTRADEAIAEARVLDGRNHSNRELGPLGGVPLLVKDLEDVAGMRTTMGSALFARTLPAATDGLVPSRLRAAGAIVVGKTNLPEFAAEGFTSNLLFGTTRNPWGLEWSPGGSSGGSAAALASGMAPIATATDGGGSIRIPAAFCGLVGIKPTNGVVGRRPIPDWIDLSTDGPFATTVADLRLLLEIESGPVAGDPTALPAPHKAMAGRPARLLATPRLIVAGPLPDAVARAFEAALDAAAEVFGMEVERVTADELWGPGNPGEDWPLITAAEHAHRFGREFVKGNLDRMSPSGRGFMEYGLGVSIDDYMAARRRRFEYVRLVDELLGADAVIMSPTVAAPGFLADGRLSPQDEPGSIPSDVYNTELANITGHPAISIPAGLSPNGIPFGLQIIAPRFHDSWLLNLADAWEERRPWPRVAPGYEAFEVGLGLTKAWPPPEPEGRKTLPARDPGP